MSPWHCAHVFEPTYRTVGAVFRYSEVVELVGALGGIRTSPAKDRGRKEKKMSTMAAALPKRPNRPLHILLKNLLRAMGWIDSHLQLLLLLFGLEPGYNGFFLVSLELFPLVGVDPRQSHMSREKVGLLANGLLQQPLRLRKVSVRLEA